MSTSVFPSCLSVSVPNFVLTCSLPFLVLGNCLESFNFGTDLAWRFRSHNFSGVYQGAAAICALTASNCILNSSRLMWPDVCSDATSLSQRMKPQTMEVEVKSERTGFAQCPNSWCTLKSSLWLDIDPLWLVCATPQPSNTEVFLWTAEELAKKSFN